jgi:dolichol-phosphate mannosyltransferase
LIPQLVQKALDGSDVVYTTKTGQEKRGMVKRAAAYLFYQVFRIIADIELDPHASDFRLINRKVLSVLNKMPEQQRFIRGLVSWAGFRQARIHYQAPPRHAGRPKYTLRRLGQLAFYGVVSFTTFPLKAPLYLGLILFFGACLYMLCLLVMSVSGTDISGIQIHIALTVLIGGLLFLCLGIMGYYMATIYQEVRGRPLYTVRAMVGFESKPSDGNPRHFHHSMSE